MTATPHARELAGSWVALRLIEALVDRYGSDERVTGTLDRGWVHVVPRIAADGADRVLDRRGRDIHSRYVDPGEHGVREPDTVHPADLTGDGRVSTTR